jgi:hypothetical protein
LYRDVAFHQTKAVRMDLSDKNAVMNALDERE